ncbi:hypothetical protein [Nocardia brasiliensis]|uniref:hypothetical protein n=1 Tax=Nocardia brasiliensis TaxID=37326 RepID=UPI00366EF65A
MRKVIVATAILMCGAVAASSCASTRTDSGTASPTEQPAFSQLLSTQDQAMIAYRDTVRPLDPCGYVDDAAIQRIGTPDYFGAWSAFSNCRVSFSPPGGDRATMITASMYPVIGGAQFEGEITPHPDDEGVSCTADVPVSDRLQINFIVYADGDFIGDHPKGDACAPVRDIAAAAVAHRLERPLRATSQRAHMNSRLATLDPCAVLGKVGQGHRPALADNGTNWNPWDCSFHLDRGDESTLQQINYEFSSDRWSLDSARARGRTAKEITIGGLRAVESESSRDEPVFAGACWIHLATPAQPPEAKPGTDDQSDDHGKSEIIAIRAHNGCAAARSTAEELARLYHQLPR